MFKIGDKVIVTTKWFSDYKKYSQPWKITHLIKNKMGKYFVTIENPVNKSLVSLHEDNLESYEIYHRKEKLEKLTKNISSFSLD